MDAGLPELSLVAKVTLVFALALLAAALARRTNAAVRASLLTAAFAVTAALPVAGLIGPERAVELPGAPEPLSLLLFDETPIASAPSADRRIGAEATPAAAWPVPSFGTLLRAAWAAGTLAFLLPLLAACWRVHRIGRTGDVWAEGQAAADALAVGTGVGRRISVFRHRDLDAPMTCGVVRPAIGLPLDAIDWSPADLHRALVHEMEHVRRADWPLHVLARAACAAYWFHPLAWIAWRRLCLESERACDDAVVRQADGAAYAQQLLWLARRLSGRPVPMLSMAAPSSLSTRVRAVLDTAQARGRAGTLSLIGIAAGAIALVIAISPLQATPRLPQTSSSPASMTTDPALRFPVASVRPADPADRSRGFGYTLETGRLNLRNQTLHTMISVAFSEPFGLFFPDERITGGPDWLHDERFTIQARAGRPVSNAEMGGMLRALLRDRFNLKVRIDAREQQIYALVLARPQRGPGPELRPAAKDCAAGGRCGIGGGAGRYELAGATMPLLAALLSETVGRPVVDRTGLEGSFDGRLTFAPPPEGPDAPRDPAGGAPAVDVGPSIFTALEEQFGLKLQPERGPVDHLVIESADRPTPNDEPDPAAREAGAEPQAAPVTPFQVASIRRNTSNDVLVRGVEIQPGGRVVAQNTPVSFLIAAADGIPPGRVEGGPAWMTVDRYDLDARGEPAPSQDDVRARLRALLADRFGLVAREQTRELPIYVLTRLRSDGPPGPALRPSGPTCAEIRPPATAPAPPPAPAGPGPSATPLMPPGSAAPACPRMFFPGFIAARQITLADLAVSLGNFVRRPVHDRTGMSGTYDLDLTFSMDGGPPGAPPAAADGHAPSIFTAVQEQLGLKLEPAVGPVTVLVVERIQRPSEN